MSNLGALRLAARSASPTEFWFWTGMCALLAVAAAYLLLRGVKRVRLIEDTPTSRIRSAAQGYVELVGTVDVMDGPAIVAPLTRTPCAWYRYRVERRTRVGDGRRSRWTTVESGVSRDLFLLRDETGQCVVDPDGAEVHTLTRLSWYGAAPRPLGPPPARRRWYHGGDYRYTEQRLHPGDPLYAIGWFRTEGRQGGESLREETAALLRAWKRDPARHLRPYDRNGDGEIDLREWEDVRRAAERQALRQRAESARDPDIHLLARPADGRPYLLSTRSEHELTRRYRYRTVAAFIALLGFATMALWMLLARFTA